MMEVTEYLNSNNTHRGHDHLTSYLTILPFDPTEAPQ